jgi:hypothetical protein
VLGAKKEGALELTMKNGLGSALTAVSLRASGEQAYQNNLVASGKKVAANEEVRLYVEDAKADAAYDIRVTKEGGGDVEFLAVPVSKIASLTLKEADGKAYVDYVGIDKANGSTKDTAVAAAAAAGTAAAAGAAAAAGSEGEAQGSAPQDNSEQSQDGASGQESSSDDGNVPEAYYADDGYDDSANGGGGNSGGGSSEAPAVSYEEPAVETTPAPAPAPAPAPSAPVQSEDVCVPDVVLR